jgi:hypothetical protein
MLPTMSVTGNLADRESAAMGEMLEWFRHQKELERFQRLSEISSDPSVRLRLAKTARLHAWIADKLKALTDGVALRQPEPLGGAVAHGRRKRYELQLFEPGAAGPSLSVEADADGDALRIAWTLRDACTDIGVDFELTCGARLIGKSRDRRGARRPTGAWELTQSTQGELLQQEEVLLSSRTAVADSRELLMATERLRSTATPKH